MNNTSGPKAQARQCFHCLESIPRYVNLTATVDAQERDMCCRGCQAAAEFIEQRGLSRFYQHRSQVGQRDFFAQVARSMVDQGDTRLNQWVFLQDPATKSEFQNQNRDGSTTYRIVLEGLYCSTCSWLIERAIKSVDSDAVVQIDINTRVLRLSLTPDNASIVPIMNTIAQLGYRPRVLKNSETLAGGEREKARFQQSIRRIVVAGFGMMQVMTYAVGTYFAGDSGNDIQHDYRQFLLLISMLVATVVVFYSGRPFFSNALNDLRNRHLGMDVPIALAIAAAYFPSVAVVLGRLPAEVYFDSAVMFVFFLSLGRFFEMRARHKLSGVDDQIATLLPISIAVFRNHQGKEQEREITPRQVQTGDRMTLQSGDIVPFDSKLLEGEAQLDEAMITGESEPRFCLPEQILLAGSRVISGKIQVEAGCDWANSSMAKIESSLLGAQEQSIHDTPFGGLFSQYFIAGVLLATTVVAGLWVWIDPKQIFNVVLAMLIAACPCAFSLAAPLGRTAAINRLRKAGVLLTRARVLEDMTQIDTWCFDKTGTLTVGNPQIVSVETLTDKNEATCLQIVAAIEQDSDHVLARPFKDIDSAMLASDIIECPGAGVSARIGGETYWVGKPSWVLPTSGCDIKVNQTVMDAQLVLARRQEPLAAILLEDQLRPSAKALIKELQHKGITCTVQSGDAKSRVKSVCDQLDITGFRADCRPQDKADWIRSQQQQSRKILMVGDGVNDAPVLNQADVAVALSSGSDLAIQQADVLLLNGRLNRLQYISEIALRTRVITRQNLIWALCYNFLALPLAAAAMLTPWIAALGMSLSSLLVVLNASRLQSHRFE